MTKNKYPEGLMNGARAGESLNLCGTPAARKYLAAKKGQSFRLYDYYKYTMSNGDLPLYDRLVKSLTDNIKITNADEFLSWWEALDPFVRVIRDGDVELYGGDADGPESEPIGFVKGYG